MHMEKETILTKNFQEIKKNYFEMRATEQTKLHSYLVEHGYPSSKAGQGKSDYTSHGQLKLPFDLSNWRWIEVKHNNFTYLISFQPFEQDPDSKNYHVLMDRIGIYKYQTYNAQDAFEHMEITDIDLPFTTEKLEELLSYLN